MWSWERYSVFIQAFALALGTDRQTRHRRDWRTLFFQHFIDSRPSTFITYNLFLPLHRVTFFALFCSVSGILSCTTDPVGYYALRRMMVMAWMYHHRQNVIMDWEWSCSYANGRRQRAGSKCYRLLLISYRLCLWLLLLCKYSSVEASCNMLLLQCQP